MKKENKILLLTMAIDLIITIVKFAGGILFNLTSLIADSLQSFADFMTDIIALIASKFGDKRANKRYPFGFGLIENISNLFIGIILFALGVFIFTKVFQSTPVEVNPIIFLILIISLLIKMGAVKYLYDAGNNLKNEMLKISAKESSLDLIATLVVLIVSTLLLFKDRFPILEHADKVGCFIIAMIIIITAIKIIFENISYLLGKTEDDESIKNKLSEILKSTDEIKDYDASLTKLGDYYKLDLTVELSSTITLRKLLIIEKKVKQKIQKAKIGIKYITFHEKEYIDK